MKTTEIYYTIKVGKKFEDEYKTTETDFMLEFDEEGTCTDGQARNPCSTWGNYTTWDNGWTEQDEDLNTLWGAIKEYSQTMECEELIAEMEETDINKEIEVEYICENFYDPEDNTEYTFTVTCYDIEYEGDE